MMRDDSAFSFTNEASGVLLVTTRGFWKDEQADNYLAELTRHCRQARVRCGRALVLVDGSDAAVQRKEVMTKVEGIASILIEGSGDRAAYVTGASIGLLQAKRLGFSDQMRIFSNVPEARDWLIERTSS